MIVQGDALQVLRGLPEESVQTCITSPPYWGLRDYGVPGQLGLEATPEAYVAAMVEVFREVRRVLRGDGTLWLNLGDSYNSSPAGNVTPSGISQNTPKRAGRLAEYNTVAKEFPGLKPKDLVGIPWRVAFALQSDGWYLRSDIIWAKPNPMPESVTDRPTKAHEYLFLLAKGERYYYDAEAIKEPAIHAGREVRYDGTQKNCVAGDGVNDRRTLIDRTITVDALRNRRSVWTIATEPYPEAHFATFPTDLVKPCVLAGSKEGDTVLDPFAGSGTTLYVAKELGRRYLGIELNPAYIALAERRLRQGVLFAP